MRLSVHYNRFTTDNQQDILKPTTVERNYLSNKTLIVEAYIVHLALILSLLLLLLLLFSIYFLYLTYFQSDH